MKFNKLLLLLFMLLFSLLSSFSIVCAADLDTNEQKIGYIYGYQAGQSHFRSGLNLEMDMEAYGLGLRDALGEEALKVDAETSKKLFAKFMQEEQATFEQVLAKNAQEEKTFFAKNAGKPDVVTTHSGLQYKIIKNGSGTSPSLEDTVMVHYALHTLDGQVLSDSRKSGNPETVEISKTISGWAQALPLMNTDAKWRLFVPAKLAFGEAGSASGIEPGEALIFDVELLSIQTAESAQ